MFTSLTSFFTKPKNPVRVPNDDTAFNTKEYPNVSFVTKGNLTGSVQIVHDGEVETGLITTRFWVNNERDAEKISIVPSFDQQTCSVVVETPSGFTQPVIYHETTVRIPTATTKLENMHIEAVNARLFGDLLENLGFRNFFARLSNGSIDLKPLYASDEIDVRTSNSAISGQFEASKIRLQTSNGHISAIVKPFASTADANITPLWLQTSNAHIDAHVDASQAVRGLDLHSHSTNGKIVMGILMATGTGTEKGTNGGGASTTQHPSLIDIASTNGKLEINVDAAHLGNALEVKTKSTNASIIQSIMVPAHQRFRTSAVSSNGSINLNLTEEFQGAFELATSNASVNVEGTDIRYSHEKKSAKQGTRGNGDLGFVYAKSSNSSVNLRFYPSSRPDSSN